MFYFRNFLIKAMIVLPPLSDLMTDLVTQHSRPTRTTWNQRADLVPWTLTAMPTQAASPCGALGNFPRHRSEAVNGTNAEGTRMRRAVPVTGPGRGLGPQVQTRTGGQTESTGGAANPFTLRTTRMCRHQSARSHHIPARPRRGCAEECPPRGSPAAPSAK